jgi:Site-specific recombinases, DNA invertase Pin homologs
MEKERDNVKQIFQIDQTLIKPKERINVCAYARVSLDSERLEHSLDAQISYYTKLINDNPNWHNSGIFYDNGISGTSSNRPGLIRLLETCENGNISIVLTKSISRFARNTLDLLEIIRHLKELNVDVWFEKENIHTKSESGELMLTLLASYAQDESHNISENVKWGFRKRAESGKPRGFAIYGYKWDGEKFSINSEEAKVIQLMVKEYLAGKCFADISRELADAEIASRKGIIFSSSSISNIIHNPFYSGDYLFQKTYVLDSQTHKSRVNHGEIPQILITDHHPAIIDRATIQLIKQETGRRKTHVSKQEKGEKE